MTTQPTAAPAARSAAGTPPGNALAGKIALVTGGNSGIGLAIARRFAAEGAQVIITGRREPELRRAAKEIGEAAEPVVADVSDLASLDRLYGTVRDRHGRLDVVVANAGGGSLAPLGQITEKQYEATYGSNVKGAIFTVQKALPLLHEGSSVILTGSTASLRGTSAFSVYGSSKAAIRALARHWAVDLRGTGIRVNVLSPGPTRTPGLLGLAPVARQQALLEEMAGKVPLGRVADPDEIARAAVFLASDASSFVQGAELFADGGEAQI
jgi:hypothetical protein